jgi:ankyrin repeat protein
MPRSPQIRRHGLFQVREQHGNNSRNNHSRTIVPIRLRYHWGDCGMQSLPVAAMLALVISMPAWAGPAEDKALSDAARFHDIGGVQSALKRGANPNAATKTARPISPIEAAAMGSWNRTRDRAADLAKNDRALKLSQAGFSDRDIDNALTLDIVKQLFAAGAKLSRHDSGALFFAIANGNVELVDLLIDKGASVAADLEGYTPAELAKKYGQEAVYGLLVSRGAVPVDSRSSAQLAFVEAAAKADVEGMEKAINEGTRVNDIDVNKQTALVAAARRGVEARWMNAVWWLLDHGADPNLASSEGLPLSVFILASARALNTSEPSLAQDLSKITLNRLLDAGAKVSAADQAGQTPLHFAAKYDNIRAAEILIKNGAKVMPKDGAGKTPLDYAESGAMIKLLKENGATER